MRTAWLLLLVVCLVVFVEDISCGTTIINQPRKTELSEVKHPSHLIQERSAWDQMYALARLPGEIMRYDFISFFMDVIILSRSLPLNWVIAKALEYIYIALKYFQPILWKTFPSTAPANMR
ncbi:uncharacterized protein LOC126881571 isoform X2 [Diabrotica virgifera virgifera]|uniref:Uncharacterized protein n=1 Tax=Diabrotica virgifera virgifera TaxID=50390 RepID=A0ABM5JV87_DIAVI|nr:uncharacterized protein LOC126881571 isoform X2 [Diabrotica virgifera virgifera]